MLPTIICFIDGVAVDRVVGFEDMGNKDDFPEIALTRRIIKSGAIKALNKEEEGRITLKKQQENDMDDGDDEY